MGSKVGQFLHLLVFGESHGSCVGVIIENLPAGMIVNNEEIKNDLRRRSSSLSGETTRKEADDVEFLSGVYKGRTDGTPLTLIIRNKNIDDTNYGEEDIVYRPSHADYTQDIRFNGFADLRGGGFSSGRLTAPLVAVGTIIKSFLKTKSINVKSHIYNIGGIYDQNIHGEDFTLSSFKDLPVIDAQKGREMVSLIELMQRSLNSVGGSVETCITNVEPGLGEPFFGGIESDIAKVVFALPAVKGVEFGLGHRFSTMKGSEVNDEFFINDGVKTKTNNNGGINGGISNGMPIIFRTIVKPTPSIGLDQTTINNHKESVKINIKGRHDSCLVRRIIPAIEAMSSFVILDNLLMKYGYEFFKG